MVSCAAAVAGSTCVCSVAAVAALRRAGGCSSLCGSCVGARGAEDSDSKSGKYSRRRRRNKRSRRRRRLIALAVLCLLCGALIAVAIALRFIFGLTLSDAATRTMEGLHIDGTFSLTGHRGSCAFGPGARDPALLTQLNDILTRHSVSKPDPPTGEASTPEGRKWAILVFSSAGFSEMTNNLLESIHRIGLSNVVVIGMDAAACDGLKIGGAPAPCLVVEKGRAGGSALRYKSAAYKDLVNSKPCWVRAAVRLGFDITFTDSDIVWLRDPYPFFVSYRGAEDKDSAILDVLAQNDLGPDRPADDPGANVDPSYVNAGFYHIRSTTGGRAFCDAYLTQTEDHWFEMGNRAMSNVLKAVRAKGGDPTWSSRVQEHPKLAETRFAMLPRRDFPNGAVYWNLKTRKARDGGLPYVVHNNYNIGAGVKKQRFVDTGLWFVGSGKDVHTP